MVSRILVIEDDLAWERLLERNLSATNRSIVTKSDIQDAWLELKKQEPFDLMVVDLLLKNPIPDSLANVDELIRIVRHEVTYSDFIPIVVVTGSEANDQQITKALTDHPGWIWGWHWKSEFDRVDFQKNIDHALQKLQEETNDGNGLLRTSLVVFGAIILSLMLVLLLIGQFAVSISETQILVGVIVTAASVVSLLIIAIAYPNRFEAIMPYIDKLLGNFRLK